MTHIEFNIVTIFPEMFQTSLNESILKKAQEKSLFKINLFNLRDFAEGKHKVTDDYPYGGGGGMIMKPEPIVKAIESIKADRPNSKVILMTPQGKTLNQAHAETLSKVRSWIIICGHYEGVDERVRQHFVDEEISIGDYILTGGEIPAMVLIDVLVRYIPGVIGGEKAVENDSFINSLLEYPQYTRPANFRGLQVPEILRSGNEKHIKEWHHKQALKRTLERRPDLLAKAKLNVEDTLYLDTMRE
ncbi:MAG TPA: tRNA (guanosine(37)-N1)-methyltransferase TrmD [Nitrospinota bacterium]|jgi:tRNA (guanine37-N1)-methyltransferase|nr:tRNA (guanosine(37)-N1)-methyltransferase TrmD [Nitrospinota bacterium]